MPTVSKKKRLATTSCPSSSPTAPWPAYAQSRATNSSYSGPARCCRLRRKAKVAEVPRQPVQSREEALPLRPQSLDFDDHGRRVKLPRQRRRIGTGEALELG